MRHFIQYIRKQDGNKLPNNSTQTYNSNTWERTLRAVVSPGQKLGGYSWDFLVGVCRPLLQIVTLFQTKKFNFSDPFSDQTSKIHTRFQTWPLDKDYVIIT